LWTIGTYWGGGAVPTQYWSLTELSLQWSTDRWRVVAARVWLPGPIPARVGNGAWDRTDAVWNGALAGMSGPYYGGS
jgi:hypothetical protein